MADAVIPPIVVEIACQINLGAGGRGSPKYLPSRRGKPPIKRSVVWTLSPLGAPLPRGLACVAMDAGPHCCRLAFFLDVVAAISDEGPGMAIGHHVGSEVAAIDTAKRDRAAVAIDASEVRR